MFPDHEMFIFSYACDIENSLIIKNLFLFKKKNNLKFFYKCYSKNNVIIVDVNALTCEFEKL